MEYEPDSKLLRIFVGEIDKVDHEPLYERIVYEAKKQDLAGATVIKGVMSFGATSRIHRSKMLAVSEDMPMVIEIVDKEDKIDNFLDTLKTLFEKAGCGGLVTMEKMQVIHYEPQQKNN
jgi:PII-like signaling protein